MNNSLKEKSETVFLLIAALFIAALVVCNLIANKFVSVPLGFKTFYVSAGILPYPLTFLITDILSEIYGKRKANKVVIAGFFASGFTLFTLWFANQFKAIPDSPVSDEEFFHVFGNSWRVVLASMTAYLTAQLIDVRIYHFWKNYTKGKHLWLRNNGSTILSQLVDTVLVVLVLFIGVLPFNNILDLIFDGWLFKVICALADTPLIYISTWILRKMFHLKFGEEIKI